MKLSLIFATLLLTTAASASVSVRDHAHMLSADDIVALEHEESALDVHVLTEETSGPSQLDNDAHNAVTGPNVLAIAIDPNHHKTAIRVGSGTGIHASDFDSIAAAGNLSFRQHNGRAGIDAIMLRAQGSAQAALPLVSTPEVPVVVQHGMSGATMVFLGLLAAAVLGLAYAAYRLFRRSDEVLEQNRLEMSDLMSRNIEENDWEEKKRVLKGAGETLIVPTVPSARSYTSLPPNAEPVTNTTSNTRYFPATPHVYVAPPPPPAPAPVVVCGGFVNNYYQNNTSSFTEGVLAAELIENSRPSHYVERDVVIERSSSSDSGGSSSSWGGDSGSSSWGSSDDSGGSSSSWGGDSGSSGGGDSSW